MTAAEPEWKTKQLKRQFPKLNLVERDTGCIYARFVAGRLLWIDADVLAGASIDAEAHAARYAAAPGMFSVPCRGTD
jgi:hypothetical protein